MVPETRGSGSGQVASSGVILRGIAVTIDNGGSMVLLRPEPIRRELKLRKEQIDQLERIVKATRVRTDRVMDDREAFSQAHPGMGTREAYEAEMASVLR